MIPHIQNSAAYLIQKLVEYIFKILDKGEQLLFTLISGQSCSLI